MSSLRNSLHRRSHKERSQLSHRSRLGILEKHKDYVLRARDYHSKQERINRLREKAATRNKDEFYFSMTKERTERGVHVQDRGNEALPVDIVKVLKTQDENYLRTMRAAGLKKIDKLKNQLTQLANLLSAPSADHSGAGELDDHELEVLREAGVLPPAPAAKRSQRKAHSKKGKHIIFAEDPEEGARTASTSDRNPDLDTPMDTTHDVSGDLGWKAPEEPKSKRRRSRRAASEGEPGEDDAGEDTASRPGESAKEHRMRLLKELSARLVRDRQLRYAERELQMQRLLMSKGAARKLSGLEKVEDGMDEDEDEDATRPKKVDEKTWKPRVYKWRVERKR
ncbi:small-subunit processome [Polyporus arcularius HHB13444]|uniref:Small-subunit processome n=1 Tax=Polyporus arcularius HHB13444 TaxID=1314778 RepID=A0A5C3PXI7_9APHY|nr:small-subunit processome [Polyporus arcularius HHB13444]